MPLELLLLTVLSLTFAISINPQASTIASMADHRRTNILNLFTVNEKLEDLTLDRDGHAILPRESHDARFTYALFEEREELRTCRLLLHRSKVSRMFSEQEWPQIVSGEALKYMQWEAHDQMRRRWEGESEEGLARGSEPLGVPLPWRRYESESSGEEEGVVVERQDRARLGRGGHSPMAAPGPAAHVEDVGGQAGSVGGVVDSLRQLGVGEAAGVEGSAGAMKASGAGRRRN